MPAASLPAIFGAKLTKKQDATLAAFAKHYKLITRLGCRVIAITSTTLQFGRTLSASFRLHSV